MAEYAHSRMPNFVVRINGAKGLTAFEEKAEKYALPKVLVFSKKSKTSQVLKALSTEYRRRLLIGEVRGSKNNADIIAKYGVQQFPAVIHLKASGETDVMDKKPSYNRLNSFLHKFALQKPYFEDEVAQKILADRESKEEL